MWVLLVSWAVAAGAVERAALSANVAKTHAVAMQEFATLDACKFASVEAQKIAPGIKVVCVPKGGV